MGGGQSSDPVVDYVAGCLAGSANIITGYPLDTGEHGTGEIKLTLNFVAT